MFEILGSVNIKFSYDLLENESMLGESIESQ